MLVLDMISYPLRLCIWYLKLRYLEARVARLTAAIAKDDARYAKEKARREVIYQSERAKDDARYAKEKARREVIYQSERAEIQRVHEAEVALVTSEFEHRTLHAKLRHKSVIREINLDSGVHLTTRNPDLAYTQSEKDILLEWTTGPAAQMRYELFAPKDHKLASAAILIQRRIRKHQRRVRAVKTCQRRIRQLWWIRYELCKPTSDMNSQYIHLLELDMETFDEKWSLLTKFWNRTY